MSEYTNYPAVDAEYNFPPEVRKAMAASNELKEATEDVIASPSSRDLVKPHVVATLAEDLTVVNAAAAAAETAIDEEIVNRDILEGGNIADETIIFAVTDEDNRRTAMELGSDGNFSDRASGLIAQKVAGPVGDNIGFSEQDEDISDLAFGVVDEDGRRTELEVGKDGKLTPRVIESIKERLNLDELGGEAEPSVYKATYDETLHKIVSGPDVCCYGDSMTAAGYPAILAGLIGRTVYNRGVGGENSVTITARSNAIPFMVTVNGGIIPATTTAVRLTKLLNNSHGVSPLIQGNAGYTSGYLTLQDGTKLLGTLSRTLDTDGTTSIYWFTRSVAGTEITSTRPIAYRSTDGDIRRGDINIIWIGQNGPSNERAIQDTWAIINNLTALHKRYLVISKPSSTDAEDARWYEEFGRRFVAIRKYLVDYGLADAGITPTAEDTSDMAAGRVPVSLRIDGTHWNTAGYTILAQQLNIRLREMGWV